MRKQPGALFQISRHHCRAQNCGHGAEMTAPTPGARPCGRLWVESITKSLASHWEIMKAL